MIYDMEEIKAQSNDSDITEEHVIFLANQYRLFLIEQKKKKEGVSSLSSSNEQTICIDLEKVDAILNLGTDSQERKRIKWEMYLKILH